MPQVRARLEAKERAVVGRAERDMEMLEKDLEELRRRDKEISQLLQSDDNAHFIQVRWKKRVDMFYLFYFFVRVAVSLQKHISLLLATIQ